MRTLGEYHYLYLKTEVLLLAGVLENFRETTLQYYEIDPCNVYFVPGFTWNALIKMTGIRLELLHDIDMDLFAERGVRECTACLLYTSRCV